MTLLPVTVDPEVSPELGSPGIVGFVFTFVLAVALVVLALSLAKQLRKVDRHARTLDPPDSAPPSAASALDGAVTPTSADAAGMVGVGGEAGEGGEAAAGGAMRGDDEDTGGPGDGRGQSA